VGGGGIPSQEAAINLSGSGVVLGLGRCVQVRECAVIVGAGRGGKRGGAGVGGFLGDGTRNFEVGTASGGTMGSHQAGQAEEVDTRTADLLKPRAGGRGG